MWHFVKAANWWQIKADPSENHRTFTVNGHPFLYTVHKDVGPVVWRFNEDPASGFSLAMYKQ
jgi:hypothetical protein